MDRLSNTAANIVVTHRHRDGFVFALVVDSTDTVYIPQHVAAAHQLNVGTVAAAVLNPNRQDRPSSSEWYCRWVTKIIEQPVAGVRQPDLEAGYTPHGDLDEGYLDAIEEHVRLSDWGVTAEIVADELDPDPRGASTYGINRVHRALEVLHRDGRIAKCVVAGRSGEYPYTFYASSRHDVINMVEGEDDDE